MANEDEAGQGQTHVLYGPAIRAGIKSGNLDLLKALLAQAEAVNRQQGDIRSAVAAARIAHTRLSDAK